MLTCTFFKCYERSYSEFWLLVTLHTDRSALHPWSVYKLSSFLAFFFFSFLFSLVKKKKHSHTLCFHMEQSTSEMEEKCDIQHFVYDLTGNLIEHSGLHNKL